MTQVISLQTCALYLKLAGALQVPTSPAFFSQDDNVSAKWIMRPVGESSITMITMPALLYHFLELGKLGPCFAYNYSYFLHFFRFWLFKLQLDQVKRIRVNGSRSLKVLNTTFGVNCFCRRSAVYCYQTFFFLRKNYMQFVPTKWHFENGLKIL